MERKQLQEPLEMRGSPRNNLQRAVVFLFVCIELRGWEGKLDPFPQIFLKKRGCVSVSSVF